MRGLARPASVILSAVIFYITLSHTSHLTNWQALLAGVLSGAACGIILRLAKSYHEEN